MSLEKVWECSSAHRLPEVRPRSRVHNGQRFFSCSLETVARRYEGSMNPVLCMGVQSIISYGEEGDGEDRGSGEDKTEGDEKESG